jgi:galactonate dehydratase
LSVDPIRALALTVAEVTPKTRWIFLEATTASGLRGVGEATLGGADQAVIAAMAALAPLALALPDASPDHLPATHPLPALPEAAAFSALDQALWDIAARRQGKTVHQALGEACRGRIPLYANINRRTLDRSPAGFAQSVRDAVAVGYSRFKIAPFDEATPQARAAGALAEAIRPGLARIEAVRAAIPQDAALMVDCHWRLDPPSATTMIDAATASGVSWIECPLPETPAHIADLKALRARANARGARLAGLEQQIRLEGFLPFVEAGAYDVMMPDVKYAGGLREMLRIADALAKGGIAFSPHNPTGPICHAASLHVCAVVPVLDALESQFDETAHFAQLQEPLLPPIVAGDAALPPGAGLGVALAEEKLRLMRVACWHAP